MRTSHALLLRFRHDPALRFEDVTVWYTDRGAPGNLSSVQGTYIKALEGYYLEAAAPDGSVKTLPYHRIVRIIYQDRVIWEKGHQDGDMHLHRGEDWDAE
jgi:hypothetical protein